MSHRSNVTGMLLTRWSLYVYHTLYTVWLRIYNENQIDVERIIICSGIRSKINPYSTTHIFKLKHSPDMYALIIEDRQTFRNFNIVMSLPVPWTPISDATTWAGVLVWCFALSQLGAICSSIACSNGRWECGTDTCLNVTSSKCLNLPKNKSAPQHTNSKHNYKLHT